MESLDSPVRLGVIGCGSHACAKHLPNAVADPDIDLKWCCDLDEEKLAQVQQRFHPQKVTPDAGDLWEDQQLEAVLIATTHEARVSLIEAAAKAGKGIYVEKPLAASAAQLRRIVQILEHNPVPFAVGHNRRMAPATQAAKEMFDRQRRNPVSPPWRFDRDIARRPALPQEHQAMVLSRINDDWYSWQIWAFQDGIAICELTHFVDLIAYFLGSDPITVSAIGNTTLNSIVSIEFEDGSLGCIFASGVGSFGYPKELWELYAEGSVIAMDHFAELRVAGVVGQPFRQTFPLVGEKSPGEGIQEMYRRTQVAQKEAAEKEDPTLMPQGPDKGHAQMLAAFCRHVRGLRPSPANLRSAVVSTLATLKIGESVGRGAKVAVEPPGWVPKQ